MIEPFLKWPGGKRWLVKNYSDLFPKQYTNYWEPFLGGGSVFFYLSPQHAVLSDTNAELINAYNCIKRYPSDIEETLVGLQRRHGKAFYYEMRQTRPSDPLERAVRFLYLNRTCFNGIYRVNRRGEFNVPIGTKDAVSFPVGRLQQIALALRTTSIRVVDFERTIDKAQADDFVFVDPPYTVMHNNNGFLKYNACLFSWEDQIRLSKAIKKAAKRGASIMMSNADHSSVRKLYDGFGTHHLVRRSSVLAGDSIHRGPAVELLITTYSA